MGALTLFLLLGCVQYELRRVPCLSFRQRLNIRGKAVSLALLAALLGLIAVAIPVAIVGDIQRPTQLVEFLAEIWLFVSLRCIPVLVAWKVSQRLVDRVDSNRTSNVSNHSGPGFLRRGVLRSVEVLCTMIYVASPICALLSLWAGLRMHGFFLSLFLTMLGMFGCGFVGMAAGAIAHSLREGRRARQTTRRSDATDGSRLEPRLAQ